jgi:hypothetical protein
VFNAVSNPPGNEWIEPAGAEYFFVPRDDSDADPARFGLIIQDAAPAM